MKNTGSKPYQPTKAERDKVLLLSAAAMSEQEISAAIGISRATLRKHFADELKNGHARKTAENLARLEGAAKAGNVAAMKFLAARLDALSEAKKPPRPERLGKKEKANLDAQTAHVDTSWEELLR